MAILQEEPEASCRQTLKLPSHLQMLSRSKLLGGDEVVPANIFRWVTQARTPRGAPSEHEAERPGLALSRTETGR